MMEEKAESVNWGSCVCSVHQGSLPLIQCCFRASDSLVLQKPVPSTERRTYCIVLLKEFSSVKSVKNIDLLNIQKCRGNLCRDNYDVCCSLSSRTIAILSLQIFLLWIYIYIPAWQLGVPITGVS